MSYYCEKCNKLILPGNTCFTQYFEDGQEKRCEECYSPQQKKRFSSSNAIRSLQNNLPKLIKLHDNIRNEDRDKKRKAWLKITDTNKRITVNKHFLGVV